MIPLTQYENTFNTMRLLIFGMSKSGKSTLAATLASKYHLIWIDLENAVETLVKLPTEVKKNIDIVRIPDSASNPCACNTIMNLFKFRKANICFNHGIINCAYCAKTGIIQSVDLTNLDPKKDIVVIDSLTQLGASVFAYVLRDKAFEYKPERDDFGEAKRYTNYIASSIQAVPFNLVMTATPTEVTMEDKRTKLVPEFGSSTMSQNIMAKFSTVIYTEVVNKKHQAFSGSTASASVVTGSRPGQAIENLPELSLIPIFEEFIAGEINQTKGTVKPLIQQGTAQVLPTQAAQATSKLEGLKIQLGKK